MLKTPCKKCGELRVLPILLEEPCVKCGYVPIKFHRIIKSIVTGLLLGTFVVVLLFFSSSSDAKERTRGYVDGKYMRTTSTTNAKGVTTTRGYVNGKYVRTTSKTSKRGVVTTRGYVGGKYVKLKSKKD